MTSRLPWTHSLRISGLSTDADPLDGPLEFDWIRWTERNVMTRRQFPGRDDRAVFEAWSLETGSATETAVETRWTDGVRAPHGMYEARLAETTQCVRFEFRTLTTCDTDALEPDCLEARLEGTFRPQKMALFSRARTATFQSRNGGRERMIMTHNRHDRRIVWETSDADASFDHALLRFFPDGEQLLLATPDGNILILSALEMTKPRAVLVVSDRWQSIDVSANGKIVAGVRDGTELAWNETARDPSRAGTRRMPFTIDSWAISPDGAYVATTDSRGNLTIVSTETGEIVCQLRGRSQLRTPLVWHPRAEKRMLACGVAPRLTYELERQPTERRRGCVGVTVLDFSEMSLLG